MVLDKVFKLTRGIVSTTTLEGCIVSTAILDLKLTTKLSELPLSTPSCHKD